jgi:hypothetical protein
MNQKGGGPKSAAFSVWPPFAFGGPILARTLTPGRSQG